MKIFSAIVIFAGMISSLHPGNASAQGSPSINHIALSIYDLEKSAAFYRDVMLLKEVDEPFKDNRHVWLKTGDHSQLHLVKNATEVRSQPIELHLAFAVKNLDSFVEHLNKLKIHYQSYTGEPRTITLRPDGIKQVYLQDPDNYWLEVNDDPL